MWKPFARTLYWALFNAWHAHGRFAGARTEPSVQWRGQGRRLLGPGAYIGARTVVEGSASSVVEIGAHAWIGQDCELSGGQLHIGPACSLQHRTQLHGDVRVGAGLVGAAGLYASSGQHEFRAWPTLPVKQQDCRRAGTPWAERSAPIEIGEDCWLGLNVVVMRGVTIGRGCIVGANSVVTRDLPPYSVAVGAPARVIDQRLAWAPPAAIDASDDACLPYFAEGFDQWPTDASQTAPLRVAEGLLVQAARFLLALAPGERVCLQLVAKRPLQLSHGGVLHTLVIGAQTLQWPTSPDRFGRLCFTLIDPAGGELPLPGLDHGLRVLGAQILAVGEGA
jgi:acetyltransferase-like isoleucine patch superfamily enzyme